MLAAARVVYRRLITGTLEARGAGRRTAGTGAATDLTARCAEATSNP